VIESCNSADGTSAGGDDASCGSDYTCALN
jgi:hypothetical protein